MQAGILANPWTHLSRSGPGFAAPAVDSSLDRLRDVAGKTVGSVFFGTLLQKMRSSTLVGRYGHGGRGEEVFAAQLHNILAERMGTAQRDGLADAMVRRMERQQQLVERAKQLEVKP